MQTDFGGRGGTSRGGHGARTHATHAVPSSLLRQQQRGRLHRLRCSPAAAPPPPLPPGRREHLLADFFICTNSRIKGLDRVFSSQAVVASTALSEKFCPEAATLSKPRGSTDGSAAHAAVAGAARAVLRPRGRAPGLATHGGPLRARLRHAARAQAQAGALRLHSFAARSAAARPAAVCLAACAASLALLAPLLPPPPRAFSRSLPPARLSATRLSLLASRSPLAHRKMRARAGS